jgi:hypothetical protein
MLVAAIGFREQLDLQETWKRRSGAMRVAQSRGRSSRSAGTRQIW